MPIDLERDLLEPIGLDTLPPEAKRQLLLSAHNELELRVGGILASGLSEAQLDEFDGLLGADDAMAADWLDDNVADWHARLEDQLTREPTMTVAGFAPTMWLEIHRPDYPVVVAAAVAEIREELLRSRDAIMATAARRPGNGGG